MTPVPPSPRAVLVWPVVAGLVLGSLDVGAAWAPEARPVEVRRPNWLAEGYPAPSLGQAPVGVPCWVVGKLKADLWAEARSAVNQGRGKRASKKDKKLATAPVGTPLRCLGSEGGASRVRWAEQEGWTPSRRVGGAVPAELAGLVAAAEAAPDRATAVQRWAAAARSGQEASAPWARFEVEWFSAEAARGALGEPALTRTFALDCPTAGVGPETPGQPDRLAVPPGPEGGAGGLGSSPPEALLTADRVLRAYASTVPAGGPPLRVFRTPDGLVALHEDGGSLYSRRATLHLQPREAWCELDVAVGAPTPVPLETEVGAELRSVTAERAAAAGPLVAP